MKAVIFNIHDVALLLLAIECGMLAILLLFMRRGGITTRRLLLALFLVLNALAALDALIFWGEEVRYRVFDVFPDIFFLFGLAVFLEGPVLYWFTRSMVARNFSFSPADALHLLPAVAAPVFLYFAYYRHPGHVQRDLILNFQIFQVPYFNLFVTAQKIIVIVYGVICLLRLAGYGIMLKNNYSNDRVDFEWLQLLVGGFLAVWTWVFMVHLVGMHTDTGAGDLMGILGIYLLLVLVNVLLFYSLIRPEVLASLGTEAERRGGDPVNPENIDRIRAVMETGKLFLNPRLTLEEFSEHVDLPPRLVSSVINRCLNQNFHEFVNRYRVEEAKRLLGDPAYGRRSILDVAVMAGFNSKAAFNRFFSKFAGITPTQYRQKHPS